jgi:F-type H+-transporting ATPase subunit epsilon
MAKTFHLTVAKVGENLFDGDAVSLTAPGREGVLTVLAQHEPYVAPLAPGKLLIKEEGGKEHEFELTNPGILEVSSNQATVIL